MNRQSPPQNLIAAATHPDPYPYYEALAAERPLMFDASLGMWVAASAAAVTAVLTDERCRVRPAAEPVPALLSGSPAGDLFRHLVRMTDGAGHGPLRQAVIAALASVREADVAAQSHRWARRLLSESSRENGSGPEVEFAFDLPTYVIGSLLGVPDDKLSQTTRWLHDFARCIAPCSNSDTVERGAIAARHLLATMRELLASNDPRRSGSLLQVLAREARCAGCGDPDTIVANAVGFLSQAHDATAGLIGNTLLAVIERPELSERVSSDPDHMQEVVANVLRHDPPIQNTRRYAVRDGIIAGQEMHAGDVILVLLAANRDLASTAESIQGDLAPPNRRSFAFGTGAHTCPGTAIALTIATVGVQHLLLAGPGHWPLTHPVRYRPSTNARIPLFSEETSS